MKRFNLNATILSALLVILAGCGGGGGGGGTPAPKTQAVTTVYLFGNFSSTSRVSSVQSELTVPEGVMVNYSSTPGVTSLNYPLRSSSIVSSGLVKIPQTETSGISAMFYPSPVDNPPPYTKGGKLMITYSNTTREKVISNSTGNGSEIATIYFKLAVADVLPVLPSPWQDLSVIVGEETSSHDTIYTTGLKLNFLTSFVP